MVFAVLIDDPVAAGLSGVTNTATELLRRGASIPPTVRVRAGTAFNVFLTGDLTFAGPDRH